MNEPIIRETDRTVEIRDLRDTLKYTITLTHEDQLESERVYIVKAFASEQTEPIDLKRFSSYVEAGQEFDRFVRNYTMIVKTQCKTLDDIDVYAEKIQYHRVWPDCCATCEFCHIDHHHPQDHDHRGRIGNAVCVNPDNFVLFEDFGLPENYGMYRDRGRYGFHPSSSRPMLNALEVKPRVDLNGICKNYSKRKDIPKDESVDDE